MTGGGFGGSAIALVPFSRVDDVSRSVRNAFAAQGLRTPDIREATPSAGAARL
jgi:galactokinase